MGGQLPSSGSLVLKKSPITLQTPGAGRGVGGQRPALEPLTPRCLGETLLRDSGQDPSPLWAGSVSPTLWQGQRGCGGQRLELKPSLLDMQEMWVPLGLWLWRGLGKWPRQWACRAEAPGGLTGQSGPNSQHHQRPSPKFSRMPFPRWLLGVTEDMGASSHLGVCRKLCSEGSGLKPALSIWPQATPPDGHSLQGG